MFQAIKVRNSSNLDEATAEEVDLKLLYYSEVR